MKVLSYTSPARGHLYPAMPILIELVGRGHEVTTLTLASELEHLASVGVEAEAIDSAIEAIEHQDWRERSPRKALARSVGTLVERMPLDAVDLSSALERHAPDVILVDVNAWGAAIAAEASGIPWAAFCPYLLPIPSGDVPPFGPGLTPLGGPLGRVRDGLIARMIGASFNKESRAPVNALREQYGLSPYGDWTEAFTSPPLMLALTAEGFEYPRSDWPANVRLVGALNWSPPAATPEWLDELGDPLVLVTCSTERQGDEELIPAALSGLPPAGFSVLATAAAHDDSAFTAPAGSRVERFVPHGPVLERAACVVCHGGMGITQKALAAGVPVVVVPFGRDQLETARRVERAEAGVRLPPKRVSGETLAKAVRDAIARQDGVDRLRRTYESAGGAPAAADEIELLAGVRK